MGISNRDYYREPTRSGEVFGVDLGSMSKRILVITVIAFILQSFITEPTPFWRLDLNRLKPAERIEELKNAKEYDRESFRRGAYINYSVLEKWGEASPRAVERGEVWRLLTYAFLHSRDMIMHIVFNMLALWSFGPLLESIWGRREFLAFYCTAAIIAGLCHVILGLSVGEYGGAIGASGAIMGLLMAFAVYYPRQTLIVYVFPIEARFLVGLYVLYDGWPIFRMLTGQGQRGDGVAHAAHLGGLAFGFLYCTMGWRLTGWLDRRKPQGSRAVFESRPAGRTGDGSSWWRRLFRPSPDLKLHTGPVEAASPQEFEDRLNRVLKRVKEVGQDNLTEEEKDLLREASRRYRERNG
jgi:membrane associated rhomboid family serine protease